MKQNLLLPNYQRYFVWEEKNVTTLIKSFNKKEFVPPITIGAFIDGGISHNYILDGQKRLTSILLAHLGIFPDKDFYKTTLESFVSDNDDGVDLPAEEDDLDIILDWNFKKLTEKGNTKEQILGQIIAGNYKDVNFNLSDDFLDKNYLGFSYLVPQAAEQDIQQKYFSSVFRNINIQGKRLLPQESRASLYFLKQDYDRFFNPEFIKEYIIKNSNADTKADFVRFLSLLSQYAKQDTSAGLARGYKPNMETYYEQYIYSVVGENVSSLFKEFTDIFPDDEYLTRFIRLKETLEILEIQKVFTSIIDMDVYFFGLIYMIIFQNKIVDVTQKDLIKQEVDSHIADFKLNPLHKRSPGALKYLKERIDASIGIYRKYSHE
ncbi:DUF262 domain-containing protein [Pedobacter jeongneungensis]|uniref:GmrSD restriction endonuclease domain-containing protein n=1 Tax=Pedobacter jeongneungensis TaxID=947309 RepID=UPI001F05E122|nr:DUF262 domain-containing protein [Pedobacter jeongneungensis]